MGDLNEAICKGDAGQIVLAHEALMEKKIGDIAERIARRRDVHFVMIAGPSSSGKTTFSHRLSTQLMACGLRPHAIATDNYFVNRDQTPRDENGQYDFENLNAMDVEQFNEDMSRLLRGRRWSCPTSISRRGCGSITGTPSPWESRTSWSSRASTASTTPFPRPAQGEQIQDLHQLSATLNVDDHNRIPTTDARLLRRIERDARTRGYSARATIEMWPSVRRGEESNIFPFRDSADVVFNSALIYEFALLKPYIEHLLFGVPKDCPE